MFLYIVRHGKPHYETDTLLPEGRRQAELCAQRLAISPIDAIYSSPMGRAIETAQPLADLLGLPVQIAPWARELGAESMTPYPDGTPKIIGSLPVCHLLQPAYRKLDLETGLAQIPGLNDSGFAKRYEEIATGLDGMLARLGYERDEQGFYAQMNPNEKHVALFCHCAMTRVMLSHIFHIPYQYLGSMLQSQFTGVTVIHFAREGDDSPSPALISYGDVGHLYTDGAPLIHYQNKGVY